MTWIEAIAVIFGLACVWLTVRQNIWCWPTGLVQVVLYAYIFWQVKLYSDLILHLVYIVLQFYGWYYWLKGGQKHDQLLVTRNTFPQNALLVVSIIILTLLWGFGMDRATDAALPYPDAFTTVTSLFAQWLLARKKLESWLLWLAVDCVAIVVYALKELYLTMGLYAVFLVLASAGYLAWRKALHSPTNSNENRTDPREICAAS